jgi:hypothetical protein
MKKINWKDLFFSIIEDIKAINDETDINQIAKNNLELSKDSEKYSIVMNKILKMKTSKVHDDVLILSK